MADMLKAALAAILFVLILATPAFGQEVVPSEEETTTAAIDAELAELGRQIDEMRRQMPSMRYINNADGVLLEADAALASMVDMRIDTIEEQVKAVQTLLLGEAANGGLLAIVAGLQEEAVGIQTDLTALKAQVDENTKAISDLRADVANATRQPELQIAVGGSLDFHPSFGGVFASRGISPRMEIELAVGFADKLGENLVVASLNQSRISYGGYAGFARYFSLGGSPLEVGGSLAAFVQYYGIVAEPVVAYQAATYGGAGELRVRYSLLEEHLFLEGGGRWSAGGAHNYLGDRGSASSPGAIIRVGGRL